MHNTSYTTYSLHVYLFVWHTMLPMLLNSATSALIHAYRASRESHCFIPISLIEWYGWYLLLFCDTSIYIITNTWEVTYLEWALGCNIPQAKHWEVTCPITMLGCDIPQPINHIHKVTNLVSNSGRTSRFYKSSDANASYIRPWYLYMALVA